MVYNDKKFNLMVESAWRAFESTLRLHGMEESQLNGFIFEFGSAGGYELVEDSFKKYWEDE